MIVAGMYAGPVGAGERALSEIRAFGPPAADFFEPTAYADFQCSLDDPPGYRNYWTAEDIAELSDTAVDVVVERSAQLPAGPSQLFIVPWGGQVARVTPETSPVAARQSAFIVHPLLLWDDPADDERMIGLGRAYRDDLRPFSSGATYLNFLGDEGPDRIRAGFGGSYDRVVQVKTAWDPRNVFQGNQSLRPTSQPRE